MISPFASIRLTASALQNGEVARGVCPWCRGGNSNEESFVITREGAVIKYHCFRASCQSSSGAINAAGNPVGYIQKTQKPKKEFDWDTFPLTHDTLQYLWDKYYIGAVDSERYGIVQTMNADLVVPVYSKAGVLTGHEIRLRNPRKAKALSFVSPNQPKLAWFKKDYVNQTDSVVIVEDVFSAIRASRFCDSVALMGSSLNTDQALEIDSAKYKRVILMLDQDASAAAVRMCRKHRTSLPHMEVRRLMDKDVKNMTPTEAHDWFTRILQQEI